MMTNTGGFQSNFPTKGGSFGGGMINNNFQRSQTFEPPNRYPNSNYPPQQLYSPNQAHLQHKNTHMPPSQHPQYPPQQPQYPLQQPQYPPQQPHYPPQQPQNPQQQVQSYGRSNTYMPPQPVQNPPMYSPQQAAIHPSDTMARANTYMPPSARPPTIYDHLQPISGPIPAINPSPANYSPSPYPSNFNPEQDCQILHKAVHGLGTDERAIINLIINRNWAQRAEIRRCYKSCYGKDLIKRLKEDTSGNFKEVVGGMFMTPPEYDAMCLYKAMKGAGTREGVLIEIIGTRTNQELMLVKDVFQREYHETLEKWVRGDTSGNFRNLLIALLQCNRSMNINPDPNMCQNDAQALYNAGEGRWGTDESIFIRIFATRSVAEMAMINDCYTRLRGQGLLKAIDKEFSGDIKKLLETVVGGLLDPAGYFAKRIRESVKGLGTNDSKLVRVIVSRSEKDLGLIKQAYQTMYGRDMLHDIRDDTSGYYREILTGLISRC